MNDQGRHFAALALCALISSAAVGCTGQRPSVSQLQTEKQKLLTRVQDEKKRNEGLEAENRGLAQRLDEAEKQLAQTLDSRGQRFAEIRRPPISSGTSSSAANSAPLNFSTPNPNRSRTAPSEQLNAPKNDTFPTSSGWMPKQPKSGGSRSPTLAP